MLGRRPVARQRQNTDVIRALRSVMRLEAGFDGGHITPGHDVVEAGPGLQPLAKSASV